MRVRIPRDLYALLEEWAHKDGLSVAAYLRVLLSRWGREHTP